MEGDSRRTSAGDAIITKEKAESKGFQHDEADRKEKEEYPVGNYFNFINIAGHFSRHVLSDDEKQ